MGEGEGVEFKWEFYPEYAFWIFWCNIWSMFNPYCLVLPKQLIVFEPYFGNYYLSFWPVLDQIFVILDQFSFSIWSKFCKYLIKVRSVWTFPLTLWNYICKKRYSAWKTLVVLFCSETRYSCYHLICIFLLKHRHSSFNIFYWLLEPLLFFQTIIQAQKTRNIS